MSLVHFHQTTNQLLGVGIYEADDNWSLPAPVSEQRLLYQPVETDEGSGCWLVFNRDRGLWGTILRSDDSPYNDCLPPSEQFLLEGFRNQNSLNALIEGLRNRTADQFLNPFHAVLGDVEENKLARFKGSFESSNGKLELGEYFLEDYRDPTDELEFPDAGVPADGDLSSLRERFENDLSEENYDKHLNQDGMRSPQTLAAFRFTGDDLKLEHASFDGSAPEWSTARESSTR